MSWPGTTPMYVIPRSSNSWPGLARLTTERRSRWLHITAGGPITGIAPQNRSQADLLVCHAPESLIFERYVENAPTVALIDISLSLSTISIGVRRWPMSLSASSERPAMSAASPTTTAIRSLRALDVARGREALGDGQARARMAAVEDVVLALATGAGSRRRRRSGGACRTGPCAR